MNPLLLSGLLGATIAGLTVIMAFPWVVRIALAVRSVDYPGGRRSHKEAIPRMGGIAIGAGIAAGAILPALLMWKQWGPTVTPWDMLALLMGAGLVFLAGLIEDGIGLAPTYRILVQLVAASGVVYAGWSFGNIHIPVLGEVHLGLMSGLVTVAWIVCVTNAVNLLDGLDGLAGGVTAIIATSLLVFAYIQSNILMVMVTSAIVGACIGFLRHNWSPARIYMGDSGSLTLGFLMAVMSLHAAVKEATTVAILVPLLALGLPVIDALLVMAVRFIERPHGSHVRRVARMFKADRNHLHHVLSRAVAERKHIVPAIYFVAACFCGMALVVAISRSEALGVALVLVEVVVIFLMRSLGRRREARQNTAEDTERAGRTYVEEY